MKVTISFLHLEHTQALDERIHEKSAKLEKFIDGEIKLKWSCFVKDGQHYAEVDLNGPMFHYHATGHTDSLYKTIDVVVDKLEKQLSKRKGKWKNNKQRKAGKDIEVYDPEMAWGEYDEDYVA
ncbi:ribosome hibernation-promoting factor, HPF/YfiA family [Halobacteriovorax sp. HLS]|uniref:ribosome hibernation-promoting factor, HPF/YfiA family n=1 Tax=Halobacteriovorax sp. HLS TaxID=2234000 RepID=UPI000FD9CFCB|nr:ribosome-associated translation inhibitor RaiA [Halobacteriovorax sp. HLS]